MKIKSLLAAIVTMSIILSGCSSDNSSADAENVSTDNEITTTENNEVSEETTGETTSEATEENTTDETETEDDISEDRNPIVRNVCWGDTKEIIKSVETENLVDENDTTLMYKTYISDYSSALLYKIDAEYGLYEVDYLVDKKDSGRSAYSAYKKIAEAVTSKYGDPINDDKMPLDSLYEYCDDDYEALELGSLAYRTQWEYNDTNITLMLARLNNVMQPFLQFEVTSFEPPVNSNGL